MQRQTSVAARLSALLQPQPQPQHQRPPSPDLIDGIDKGLAMLSEYIETLSPSPSRRIHSPPSKSTGGVNGKNLTNFDGRSSLERREGFLKALEEAGIHPTVMVAEEKSEVATEQVLTSTTSGENESSRKELLVKKYRDIERGLLGERQSESEEGERGDGIELDENFQYESSAHTRNHHLESKSTYAPVRPLSGQRVKALDRIRRHNFMRLKSKSKSSKVEVDMNIAPASGTCGVQHLSHKPGVMPEEVEENELDGVKVGVSNGLDEYVGDADAEEKCLLAELGRLKLAVEARKKTPEKEPSDEYPRIEESETFLTDLLVAENVDEERDGDGEDEGEYGEEGDEEDEENETNQRGVDSFIIAKECRDEDGEESVSMVEWLNSKKLYKVVHPTGARVRRTPELRSPGLAILQPG